MTSISASRLRHSAIQKVVLRNALDSGAPDSCHIRKAHFQGLTSRPSFSMLLSWNGRPTSLSNMVR